MRVQCELFAVFCTYWKRTAASQQGSGMDELHLMIHPLDTQAERGPVQQIGPLLRPTLRVSSQWAITMLPLTFEQAMTRLEQLPLAYTEPDGSFSWSGSGPQPFQLQGLLHDRGERLSHVEIMGHGYEVALIRLITTVAGDLNDLMIQSVREGKFFTAAAECNTHQPEA
jgi:hypothetical protein